MTITFSSDSPSNRLALPANLDSGQDGPPFRDNPWGEGSHSREGLLGLYPYSGADIKLVVHLPPEDPEVINTRLSDLQANLTSLQSQAEMTSTAAETTQLEVRIQTMRDELQNQHDLLAITDPISTEYNDIQVEITELNAAISELTDLFNVSAHSGTRDDIEEEIAVVTRAINSIVESEGNVPASRTKVLGEIQTLSLSDHREKYPVRTLGSVYPRSITRGPRTISGSVVFTTFNQHLMHEFMETSQYRSTGVGDWDRFRWTTQLMDQLPPLDISISFANEYGNMSWMAILGVEFVNEGQVMSIEDLFIEGTAQYIARDYDPIRSVANRRLTRNQGVGQSLTGSNLMIQDLRRRVARRNNPWI